MVVSPLNYNLETSSPIVNVSLVVKDIVRFNVPTRGYYEIDFTPTGGYAVTATYIVDEGGVPYDLLAWGAGVAVVGGGFLVAVMLIERRTRRALFLKTRVADSFIPSCF